MSDQFDSQMYEPDEQEIHLRDYLHVLLKRKLLIITILFSPFSLPSSRPLPAIPLYTASADVLIERNRGNRGLETTYWASYEPDFLATQTEIIRSVNVAARVVDQLALSTRYRHFFFDSSPAETTIWKTATAAVKGWIGDTLRFFSSADTVADTGSVSAAAGIETEPVSDEEIIARMIRGGLSVEPLEETKIVSISYTHKNPAMAQLVANAVVKAYMDEMLEIKLATSATRSSG